MNGITADDLSRGLLPAWATGVRLADGRTICPDHRFRDWTISLDLDTTDGMTVTDSPLDAGCEICRAEVAERP